MGKTVLTLILAVAAFAVSIPASAQYTDEIHRKGSYLYSGETRLDSEQVRILLEGIETVTYEDYVKYRKNYNAGKGMLIGFSALTGVGAATSLVGIVGIAVEGIAVGTGAAITAMFTGSAGEMDYKSTFAPIAFTGFVATGIGILGIAAGATTFCVYKGKLNDLADTCNYARGVSVSLGGQRHGIGLALNF